VSSYWVVRASVDTLRPWNVLGPAGVFDAPGDPKPFETRRDARLFIQSCEYDGRLEIWPDERVKTKLVTQELEGYELAWEIDTRWLSKPRTPVLTKPPAPL
jgi:hypothetical protein